MKKNGRNMRPFFIGDELRQLKLPVTESTLVQYAIVRIKKSFARCFMVTL